MLMKNTKLVWRLKEQPTTDALKELVVAGLLTKDEARQILFSSESEEERDKKSLEMEIKFLKELVEKLSSRSQIVEVIKEIKVPYYTYTWAQPYFNWATPTLGSSISNAVYASNGNTLTAATTNGSGTVSFSSIKTY